MLKVRQIDDPIAAPERLVVRVKAVAINPGEIAVREGAFEDVWPATFPSRQELAEARGVVHMDILDGAGGPARTGLHGCAGQRSLVGKLARGRQVNNAHECGCERHLGVPLTDSEG